MEIRDPIHGPIEINPLFEAIIEQPAFQRLRSIKQLGFGEFSFPGATHNRYIHSLGVSHLAGKSFDSIFQGFPFSQNQSKWRLRQCVVLGALLHDIGHGPLSHTTEEVMPMLSELNIPCYKGLEDRQATHEDYTIKFITDSMLTEELRKQFADIDPIHIASLIDRNIVPPDDFFFEGEVNLRPILAQIVSSELDADRMDYLLRDSYFTGATYGKVDVDWLIANFTYHQVDDRLQLAINRKALYTFDDFLVSRHHMYLQVYFHHKAIIYDEILNRYLTSKECNYSLPADIDEYLLYVDSHLYEHLRDEPSEWAQRISQRRPYKVLFELHNMGEDNSHTDIIKKLKEEGLDFIHASSTARLSKYHNTADDGFLRIYVKDQYDKNLEPFPIEQCTQVFQNYEGTRCIDRIYAKPEQYTEARSLFES
ncbi:MAG: HD domain-containing protein [Bdellovibrionales bacterium]